MSAPIKDGGSAFPVMYCSEGMSLRDYFAGQALAGMMGHKDCSAWTVNEVSSDCYAHADAMLAARERKEDAK